MSIGIADFRVASRSAFALASSAIALGVFARAQVTAYEWPDVPHPTFVTAHCAEGIGDFDGDGVEDLVIGRRFDLETQLWFGSADIVSGRDGRSIRRLDGRPTHNQFGAAIARLGDVDGDGRSDFAVAAPQFAPYGGPRGYVRLFAAGTGALIREIPSPTFAKQLFGGSMRGAPDLDGDGAADLLVGAYNHIAFAPGVVYLFSGATGAVVREWRATNSFYTSMFGCSVDVVSDMDGDGLADVLIGNPFGDSPVTEGTGSVHVYSSVKGNELKAYSGDVLGQWFGASVASLGDVDFDGVDDIAIGRPDAEFAGSNVGRVRVVSGASGALLYELSAAPRQIGWSVVASNDHDGDGARDFFAAIAPGWPWTTDPSVWLVSGRTGQVLANVEFAGPLTTWATIGDAGDVNADGRRDLCVSVRDPASSSPTGSIRLVLSGVFEPVRYCTAKRNSLSCTPWISASGAASVSIADNFTLRAHDVINQKSGVLLWGAGALNAPFSGGTLCVAPNPTTIRGPMLDSRGSPPPAVDCSGSFEFHFSHALIAARGLTAGQTLHAQFFSRDPGFAPPRNIGFTDALRFDLLP